MGRRFVLAIVVCLVASAAQANSVQSSPPQSKPDQTKPDQPAPAPAPSSGQSGKSDYEPATIVAVKEHELRPDGTAKNYEVTVEAGSKQYVVLVTPPSGANRVAYSAGQDVLCRIGANTIAFNDMLGRNYEFPILSTKEVPDRKPH